MLSTLLGLITGKLAPWIIGASGVLVAVVTAWIGGGRRAKTKHMVADLTRAVELKEQADADRKRSADDERSGDDRLREHGRLGE
tara:strand:+ start:10950 stop:11201 length:252 start_codon:yes stop_codon:yes gene_type:complete